MKDKQIIGKVVRLILLTVFAIVLLSPCNLEGVFSKDKYCYHIPSYSNTTYGSNYNGWDLRSHEQDRINAQINKQRLETEKIMREEFKICYDAGSLINESFTIKDYDLNCEKIDYLNDHLMDNFEKRNAGYISVSYDGFFTSRSTKSELYQYVNDRILATGQLIENINYWVDCNENKHHENIDHFTEEEFVMYYVEECIE